MGPRVTAVLVSYNSADALKASLPALVRELVPDDEVVVVDNGPGDASVEVVRRLAPGARILVTGANLGFPEGCNRGAAVATGDVLLFVNPDAVAAPGFGSAIRRPWSEHPDWGAWQALVTCEGGTQVNTAGNEVHLTGVAWAGQFGVPLDRADLTRREVPYCSGACLAVRREAFRAVGGFDGWFFLYHEDLDLSLRLRLAGWRLGIEPDARVDHDYEFAKGGYKWRLMERNRWAALLRCWPGPVLALAAPALLAAEAAILLTARREGWGADKRRSLAEVLRRFPRLLRERRSIQRARRVTPLDFARWLTPRLLSPYFAIGLRTGAIDRLMRGYWAAGLRLIGRRQA